MEIPIFINKLMCQSSLINTVPFVFCEFNCIASWNEGKTIILLRSSFQFPNRNTGFIFKYNHCQCKHVFFLEVILKETLLLMCLASLLKIIESWKLILGHRAIYYAKKIINTFVCVEIRILVEMWYAYEGHIFPRSLLQTCRL